MSHFGLKYWKQAIMPWNLQYKEQLTQLERVLSESTRGYNNKLWYICQQDFASCLGERTLSCTPSTIYNEKLLIPLVRKFVNMNGTDKCLIPQSSSSPMWWTYRIIVVSILKIVFTYRVHGHWFKSTGCVEHPQILVSLMGPVTNYPGILKNNSIS